MATHLDSTLLGLRENMGRFARQEIATRRDMQSTETFPHDLWGKLAAEQLMGIAIPKSYGGGGGNYLTLLVAAEAMVQNGRNMGFALSWLMQETIARFVILSFAGDHIRNRYLPELVRGRIVVSLAISEPDVFAHPKHLTASAVRQEDTWIVNGRKTMITNGPIADLFIVLAVTGQDGARKAFSAFLVPKETPGLAVTEPIDLGFLRPSQHGGIELYNCVLDDSSLVGTIGTAYRDIALPFRDVEDMLLNGVITGGFARLLELGLEDIRRRILPASSNVRALLGELADYLDTLGTVAREAAVMTDSTRKHAELPSLLITFKSLAEGYLGMYRHLASEAAVPPGPESSDLMTDLEQTIRIADYVNRIKRIRRGDTLLSGKE